MKKYEDEIVGELSSRYCKTKDFIILLLKICKDNNIQNSKESIEQYLMCQEI